MKTADVSGMPKELEEVRRIALGEFPADEAQVRAALAQAWAWLAPLTSALPSAEPSSGMPTYTTEDVRLAYRKLTLAINGTKDIRAPDWQMSLSLMLTAALEGAKAPGLEQALKDAHRALTNAKVSTHDTPGNPRSELSLTGRILRLEARCAASEGREVELTREVSTLQARVEELEDHGRDQLQRIEELVSERDALRAQVEAVREMVKRGLKEQEAGAERLGRTNLYMAGTKDALESVLAALSAPPAETTLVLCPKCEQRHPGPTNPCVLCEAQAAYSAEQSTKADAEMAADAETTPEDVTWLEPFCACGRRLSQCDGSRRGCKTPRVSATPPAETTPAPERQEGAPAQPHRMLSALDVRPAVPPVLEQLPEADPYVSRVTEFHEAMGLPVRHGPDVGTVEERVLAGKLILEEAFEFLRGAGVRVLLDALVLDVADVVIEEDTDGPGPDLVQMLHELADLQYVVSGRAVQFGLPVFAAIDEEIHPANLRKRGPDGKVLRRADGKVIKPEGWVSANVARVLRRAQEGRPSLPERIDSSLAKLGHELTPTGRLVASEVDAMLHPSGRCTCAGEGQCEWCRARCDACGSPYVPESVRRAVVRVWSALRVTTPEQGAAVAVLRAVYPELPVPDGDEGHEAVKLLTNRQAARVQGALGMRKPPDALGYQDVVLMAQACKAALADVLDRHDLPEPAHQRVALVHNNLVDVWQGVAGLQDLAGSAMARAVLDAARLGATDMRERAAREAQASGDIADLAETNGYRELEGLLRDLPLPGEEVPRG
ncbi:hypothetical protein [Corallococcus sp. EGB]|uniref:hypothetical protein n=1 Tax=Corallococcus sp. EGB TaxID=1521117 RepID=UPI002714FA1C|nr:hypothetical protein [Corallococcus sp. EGB]